MKQLHEKHKLIHSISKKIHEPRYPKNPKNMDSLDERVVKGSGICSRGLLEFSYKQKA